MSQFKKIAAAPPDSKFILQGNAAFALGVVHAGYHAADGYPGTPSTEVIDRSLAYVQDKIQVGWSVNEAVAVGVAVGRAIAGFDSVVTMKIPGVFQAGDAISTAAFYTAPAGALVIYAATDYVPSSTQHVIDARPFFASARLPVLEPRSHQELYEIAWNAADMSRMFNTPVIILASGILTHSEGLVVTRPARTVVPREIPANLHDWMLMPAIARTNYDKATRERIPAIRAWLETSNLATEIPGTNDWGIIVNGESSIIVQEALAAAAVENKPALLTLAAANPIPEKKIKAFADKIKKGKLFIIEDGDTFLQEKIRLLGIDIIGKDENSTVTSWTPETVLEFLAKHADIQYRSAGENSEKNIAVKPLPRPPSICPGCPYRAFALAVARLKRQKKIFAVFGDIGCSTLLYFLDALDTVCCMGASDSIRQGFVMSRPEMANRTISVIGDSCECHCGLDSTRSAVFRNVPGVKVILDNRVTAMTGGQPAPSSEKNLAGQPHKFSLKKAVAAEVEKTIIVDAFNLKQVEQELKIALDAAGKGEFSVLILEGPCIQEVDYSRKTRQIQFDYDKCKRCGLCNICPGIAADENQMPYFTNLCADCGGNTRVCMQRCPHDAIIPLPAEEISPTQPPLLKIEEIQPVRLDKEKLPPSMRLAVRGIGGQGNLFLGKVLSEVALRTPYAAAHIVKGDTHGMAQLGGPVISTFSCGEVFSPVLAPHSADLLIVMEISEVLRPGFLELLKPGGAIIFNEFTALPVGAGKEDYPPLSDIEQALSQYNVIKLDANKIAYDIGDSTGRTANVVILGLVSALAPFNCIPEQTWLSALTALSPTDFIKTANITAFREGKKLALSVL